MLLLRWGASVEVARRMLMRKKRLTERRKGRRDASVRMLIHELQMRL